MKNRLKYHHITHPDGHRMTVASEVHENGQDVYFGFAFCSEKDRFVKKVGRNKARGAMLSHSKAFVTEFSGHSSDDLCKFWNSNKIKVPQIWKNTVFGNIPKQGIVVVKKV